jgi:hypothetical protein
METAMDEPAACSNRVFDELHPQVLTAAAGLLIWFVVAAWFLFGGAGYIELALAMVSVLVFMALAIPMALWRAGTAARRADPDNTGAEGSAGTQEASPKTLSAWLRGRFATWTDLEKPSTAAIEVLLPLAAVAFGLTAIGIVFHLARMGV